MRNILSTTTSILIVRGYSNADWVGFLTTVARPQAIVFFFGSHLVSRRSKKKNVVARSSAGAKYRALANIASELLWFRQLLTELGFVSSEPLLMFCDNQVAINFISNPIFHERTKHIEVDRHFLSHHISTRQIFTPYLQSKDQFVDMLTKAIS